MVTLTYQMSPDELEKVRKFMASKGVQLDGNSGEFKKFGADVSYLYEYGVLNVGVIAPPVFHSLSNFVAEIDKAVKQVIGG